MLTIKRESAAPRYYVTLRGEAPPDLVRRITQAYAAAIQVQVSINHRTRADDLPK